MNKGPSNLRLSEKESPKANRLSRDMCESVIGYLLLQGYLKEDFHFTPYSTISYLVLGKKTPTDQLSMEIQVNTTASTTKSTAKKKLAKDSSAKTSTKRSRVESVTLDSDSE